MRRLIASFVCALACAGLAVRAQNPPAQQTPPPVQAPPAQQPPPSSPPAQQGPPPAGQGQQQPVFRGEIDVIRVDVSVLDKDRRPVRGLKLEDFTVYEDGKQQRLVAVSEVDAATNDPVPSAWMRNVPRDVAANNLGDQIGEGRVVAIVMDDWNIPFDDLDMIMNARSVGRYIVDQLGPSDVAAVIFPQQAGRTQDFTEDRRKLLAAIEKFDPPEVRWIEPTPVGTSGGGADMPYRSSPALMRNQCQRSQPTIPTLDTISSRLATIQNRRKTLFLVSTGVPLSFASTRDCPGELAEIMKDVFRKAQRSNINIYSIDPSGYRGYENYLQNPIRRAGRPAERVASERGADAAAKVRRDFLEITADHTGARAIVNDNDVGAEIDQIFEEAGADHLVGYQTSNGRPDGRFRKLEVKVNRSGATVRTRSGFYAPKEGTLTNPELKGLPSQNDLGLTGLMTPASLPLRTAVIPVARTAGPGSRDVDVAVVLTVRLPATRGTLAEKVTLVRTLYDAEGRAGPPTPEKVELSVPSSSGDELRYDLYQRLTLAPGRYAIRLNATSAALDRSGSVYADIEVPDFSRPAVSATSLVLGTRPPGERTDVLAKVLPILPTSARDFAGNDPLIAFLRIFQGGDTPVVPIAIATQILDASDTKVFEAAGAIKAEDFDASRSAPFEIALPIAPLKHGPYLLSITATLPNGASTRRDSVFRMR